MGQGKPFQCLKVLLFGSQGKHDKLIMTEIMILLLSYEPCTFWSLAMACTVNTYQTHFRLFQYKAFRYSIFCRVCVVDGVILITLLLMEPIIPSLKTALMSWWNRLSPDMTTSVFTLTIITVMQKMDSPALNPLLFSTNLQKWCWLVNSWMVWWPTW